MGLSSGRAWLGTAIVLVAIAVLVGLLGWRGHDAAAPRAVDRTATSGPATSGPVTSAPAMTAPTPEFVDAGTPQRLLIDAIGVAAPVLALGTAPDGSQEVPPSLTEVGWWRHGARPGMPGNTVITGHAARADDGVFDDLGTLSAGDRFRIVGERRTATYVVTGRTTVDVDDFAEHAPGIYRTDGPSGAVLMTCSSWNGQVYETTTIVRARLLPPGR